MKAFLPPEKNVGRKLLLSLTQLCFIEVLFQLDCAQAIFALKGDLFILDTFPRKKGNRTGYWAQVLMSSFLPSPGEQMFML